jgi:hypothetical protein
MIPKAVFTSEMLDFHSKNTSVFIIGTGTFIVDMQMLSFEKCSTLRLSAQPTP